MIDLAETGAALGSLPGGAAVLCLAHDCLVQHPGGTEGFVRTDLLLSATSAFITLRRSLRTAADTAAAAAQHVAKAGSNPLAPILQNTGNPIAATTEAAATIAVPSPAVDRGDTQIAATTTAVVAEMEVAAELKVYGEELCINLARVSSLSASDARFSSDGKTAGATGSPCSKSQPQHPRIGPDESYQTRHIWRAVKKHSGVLSPQSVCALTALLAAKHRAWVHHGHDSNNLDVGNGESLGGETSSPAGDPTAWEAALYDALLAVRTASLQHLALWADACDSGKLESACVAEVSAATWFSPGTGDDENEAGKAEVQQELGGDGGMTGGGRGGRIEATWAALHRASGIGLSPLMMLAATLSDEVRYGSAKASLSLSDVRNEAARGLSAEAKVEASDLLVQGVGVGGTDDGSGAVDFTRKAARTVLRLLSPGSLLSLYRCATTRAPDPTAAETTAAEPTFRLDGHNTTLNGGVAPKAVDILPEITGHPAIGDLSSLDADTLERGAAGIMMALDAKGTGVLPPAVLAVALQSGEAGFRLEPHQADVVLQLAGKATFCCLLGSTSSSPIGVSTFLVSIP